MNVGNLKQPVKLFKDGIEICDVSFDLFEKFEELEDVNLVRKVPTICYFTMPVDSPIIAGGSTDYELRLASGARFPIRIRHVFLRMNGVRPLGRDISAELMTP